MRGSRCTDQETVPQHIRQREICTLDDETVGIMRSRDHRWRLVQFGLLSVAMQASATSPKGSPFLSALREIAITLSASGGLVNIIA